MSFAMFKTALRLIALFIFLVFPALVFAQKEIRPPIPAKTFSELFATIAQFIVLIAGPIAVFVILWAGFLFMTSGGDVEKVKKAKQALLWAIVGLMIVLVGQGFVLLVRDVLKGRSGIGPAPITLPEETLLQEPPPQDIELVPEDLSAPEEPLKEPPPQDIELVPEDLFTDVELPATIPDEELRSYQDYRVANSNVYIDTGSFSAANVPKLRQWTEEALDVFSDQYRAAGNITIVDDIAYQVIVAEGYFQKLPQDKAYKIAQNSTGAADHSGNIFISGGALLEGIKGINPNGYNVQKEPQDVIIHENAHAVENVCNCFGEWRRISVEGGHVSPYAETSAGEDFAETVVAYKRSGGDPRKVSQVMDPKEQEALGKKFEFLEKHNIVKKPR